MSTGNAKRICGALLAVAVAASLQGCDKPSAEAPAPATAQAHYEPIKIEHPLGTTLITKLPERVVAFDMSELDTLDQLGAPVVGIAKDYVANFLVKYRDNPNIMDVGSTIQPNLERLHALKPDLILISPLQAQSYAELSQEPFDHPGAHLRQGRTGPPEGRRNGRQGGADPACDRGAP